MKKILFLSRKDPKHPKAGGAEVVMHEYMKGFVAQGYEVTQFSPSFKGAVPEETIDGVKIIRVFSIHTIYFLFGFYYLFNLRGKYDIVIDHAGGIPFLSPLYIRNKPIYFFIHHIGTKEWSEYFSQWIGIGWVGSVFRWIYNAIVLSLYRNKTTITVSQGTGDELKKLGFQKVTVLLNTTDYPRVDKVVKKGLELTVVGRVVPNKQFTHAIELVHQLCQQGFAYTLNIVGVEQDPLESQKLHNLVSQHELEKYIIFHGSVDTQDLVAIWDRTQYGLIVSDKEGFGITALEANARGVPVIAYDIPGVNEAIKDKVNGYLCEKNNISAIAQLIIDREDNYDDLVSSTHEYISHYPSWQDNIDKFTKLI